MPEIYENVKYKFKTMIKELNRRKRSRGRRKYQSSRNKAI